MVVKNTNKKETVDLEKFSAKLSSKSPFVYREAYKSLRTNVMFAMAASAKKSNIVVISSALPNECKSTLASNLALTMAELGVKVLLVDADLRNPTQHHIFKLGNIKGLSQLIVGLEKFDDVVNRDIAQNLDIITAGGLAPNPSELLGSENMADLLSTFEQMYEYVIVDTPPINVVTDALMFLDMTAGVVLAIKKDFTTYADISKTMSSLEITKTPILGAVMFEGESTSSSFGKSGKYGKYGKYGGYGSRYGKYGYGYGYGYGKNINK